MSMVDVQFSGKPGPHCVRMVSIILTEEELHELIEDLKVDKGSRYEINVMTDGGVSSFSFQIGSEEVLVEPV